VKTIFWLVLDIPDGGHYRAVVIESTKEEAQRRACMMDEYRRNWRESSFSVQAKVACTRTPQVLAMDGV